MGQFHLPALRVPECPLPDIPGPEESNAYQSARALMMRLADSIIQWRHQLPSDRQPAILAVLNGGLQIAVERLAEESFHGIRIEGRSTATPAWCWRIRLPFSFSAISRKWKRRKAAEASGSSSMEKNSRYERWVEQWLLSEIWSVQRGYEMNLVKVVGVLLIVAGVLGVVFNSFSFTKETHELKLGPIELSVKEKQAVDIPVWASVGAIVVGGLLLVFGNRKG
jgi:hypothetical protein